MITIDPRIIDGGPTTWERSAQQPSSCNIELTLCHPQTSKFLKLTSAYQKLYYDRIYQKILCTFGMHNIKCSEHVYEYTKCGQIHMHASIELRFPTPHFPLGVVSDIVKTYLNEIPSIKCNRYNDACMHVEWQRYRCPSIVCQYRPISAVSRLDAWQQYIRKTLNILK